MKDALGQVQSILVLGGGSDIAIATCRKLAGRRGARVVLAGRTPGTLDDAAKQILDAGASSVETVAFDATDFSSHAGFVDETFERFGDFDVVLIAFGVLGDQETAERDAKHALDIVHTNYNGTVSVMLPLADRLKRQGHGTLVLLSSVAGERVRRSNFVYGSSKAGIDGFAQGLADAMVGSGARLMIVRPGFVHTKMTAGMKAAPLSVDAETVADAIVQGLTRGREIVWVPAPLRYVMMVLRHVPRVVFRRLPL